MTPEEEKQFVSAYIERVQQAQKLPTILSAWDFVKDNRPDMFQIIGNLLNRAMYPQAPPMAGSLQQYTNNPELHGRILAYAKEHGVDFNTALGVVIQGKQPNTGHLGMPLDTRSK